MLVYSVDIELALPSYLIGGVSTILPGVCYLER